MIRIMALANKRIRSPIIAPESVVFPPRSLASSPWEVSMRIPAMATISTASTKPMVTSQFAAVQKSRKNESPERGLCFVRSYISESNGDGEGGPPADGVGVGVGVIRAPHAPTTPPPPQVWLSAVQLTPPVQVTPSQEKTPPQLASVLQGWFWFDEHTDVHVPPLQTLPVSVQFAPPIHDIPLQANMPPQLAFVLQTDP